MANTAIGSINPNTRRSRQVFLHLFFAGFGVAALQRGNERFLFMTNSAYVSNLPRGARVRLTGPIEHARAGEEGTIIYSLPNPSGRAENQWYDVRFRDGSIGRFLERYLVRIDASGENRAA
jgi:hypothetical protein